MPALGANPLVLIPGFMGSQLSRVRYRRLVWVDPAWAVTHLHDFLDDLELRTPTDPVLSPSGIVHDLNIGDLVRVGVYREFHEFALSGTGLGLAPRDYHEFTYDWRKSLALAASDLDAILVRIADTRPVTAIAHSQGGLVVAKLSEQNGPGASKVGEVVAIGCPFAGLLKTIDMIGRGSGILSVFFPEDPIRELLRGMPGTYGLMPSRTSPMLFLDSIGTPSTPFQQLSVFPSERYAPDLLAATGLVLTGLSLNFSVPLTLIEGYGCQTAVLARVENGTLSVEHGIEVDGTCPPRSLQAASGIRKRVFSVPFGEHVELVRNPAILEFVRSILVRGLTPGPQLAGRVEFPAHVPGASNLLIVKTRDGSDEPLGNGKPAANLPDGTPVSLEPCPIAGAARWPGRFSHPTLPGFLQVRIPGVASADQLRPIPLV